MSNIQFECPHCHHLLETDTEDNQFGQIIYCPACKQTLKVPHIPSPKSPLPSPPKKELRTSLVYTNFLLSIIAGCMVYQVSQTLAGKFTPTTSSHTTDLQSVSDVRIVATSGMIPVNIESIGGDTLSRVEDQVVLPVGVHNTVETKIVSPIYSQGLKDGLGVILLNN